MKPENEIAGNPPARPVQIGVVDDHPVVRDALRRFLRTQDGMHVVAEGASGRDAIDLVRRYALDVLLLDISMPGQGAIDALPMVRAKSRNPRMGVLVLSGYPERLYALPCLRQGASGYLDKCADPAEIAAAVRQVAQGRRWMSPAVAQQLADEVLDPVGGQAHGGLSSRELQVFLKLARGRSMREVASELSLSPKTIGTHRTRLMRKLQARSASDLTYYAVKHRLVD